MSSPLSKRRRIDPDTSSDEACKVIERDPSDIRSSLQALHSCLDALGDVIIVVQGEKAKREFRCVSALLSSASRPLRAMLYGPMRATTCFNAEEPPRLNLSMTEPWCFDCLLKYVHGLNICALPCCPPAPPSVVHTSYPPGTGPTYSLPIP